MNQMKKAGSLTGSVLLLLAAMIWGTAFVAQSMGMNHVGPFTFLFCRWILGAGVTGVMLLVKKQVIEPRREETPAPVNWKKTISAGVICGVVLTVSSALQQIGMVSTEPGKAGFITSMYLLLVPILGLFIGRKVEKKIWLCVAAAVVGLYLLCIDGELAGLERGDALVALCALAFAFHILAVDILGKDVDSIALSFVQYVVVTILSGLCMVVTESPSLSAVLSAAGPILYAGIMSSGLAFTFQIIGQKTVQPTAASLLMCMESVFSVVGGFLILQQAMSGRELLGCCIMFGAVIVAQIPGRQKSPKDIPDKLN